MESAVACWALLHYQLKPTHPGGRHCHPYFHTKKSEVKGVVEPDQDHGQQTATVANATHVRVPSMQLVRHTCECCSVLKALRAGSMETCGYRDGAAADCPPGDSTSSSAGWWFPGCWLVCWKASLVLAQAGAWWQQGKELDTNGSLLYHNTWGYNSNRENHKMENNQQTRNIKKYEEKGTRISWGREWGGHSRTQYKLGKAGGMGKEHSRRETKTNNTGNPCSCPFGPEVFCT